MGATAVVFLGAGNHDADAGGRQPKLPRRLSAVEVGADPAGASNQVLSALLVEDDPSMRLLVKYNLEAAGFRVTVASTGEEALELAARERPDVALLDVMLPDLGGFEVAEHLHGVPIIFMSARGSESDLEHGRRAGAIDYVTKPFDPVALPARIREDLEALARAGDAAQVWALRADASR